MYMHLIGVSKALLLNKVFRFQNEKSRNSPKILKEKGLRGSEWGPRLNII